MALGVVGMTISLGFGCGGAMGRMTTASRLPPLNADTEPPETDYPAAASLSTVELSAEDWATAKAERAAILCDMRGGKQTLNAELMAGLQGSVGAKFKKIEAAQADMASTATGRQLVEVTSLLGPTTSVDTIGILCEGGKALFVVNGRGIRPDVIYAQNGQAILIEGVSLTAGQVLYVRLTESASEFVAVDIKRYLPQDVADVLARPVTMQTAFETFFPQKTGNMGLYLSPPIGGATLSMTLGVAKFQVK